jgi:acetyl/propionyl-CoA carboxylase alpha subunit
VSSICLLSPFSRTPTATPCTCRMADEAVPIGPPPAKDSYLRADKILEAAA